MTRRWWSAGRDRSRRHRTRLSAAEALLVAALGPRSRPLRAALSALGVAVGVAALVAVVTVTVSRQAEVRAELDALGANLLVVEPAPAVGGGSGRLRAEAPDMIRRVGPVEQVAAVRALEGVAVHRSDLVPPEQTGGLTALVVDQGLLETLDLTPATGRWFDDGTRDLPTVVLGSVAADRLGLSPATATRARLSVGGTWYAVRGVLEPAALAPVVDRAVLLSAAPSGAAEGAAAGDDGPTPTSVFVRTATGAAERVRAVLRETADPVAPTSVAVTRLSDLAVAQETADDALSGLVLGLAAITLVVGGIGVANTMVVAVLERRSEIGLRRALGARPGQVLAQFALEAVLLGLVGGLVGTAVGVGVAGAVAWSGGGDAGPRPRGGGRWGRRRRARLRAGGAVPRGPCRAPAPDGGPASGVTAWPGCVALAGGGDPTYATVTPRPACRPRGRSWSRTAPTDVADDVDGGGRVTSGGETSGGERDRAPRSGPLRADRDRAAAARRLVAAVGSAPLRRVARVACDSLGAPGAQVSLVADEVTVVAAHGAAYAPTGSCASFEDALCTRVLAVAGPLAVADARADPRLRDLPPVADGHVRAYLGAPLVDESGRALGVLCVHGPAPRHWSDAEVGVLQAIAATATATLELAAGAAQRFALLASVSQDLASADDVREAVGRLTRRLVPALGSWCVITVADEHGALEDLASWHADPSRRPLVARYAALRQSGLRPESPLHEALRSGRPVVVPDVATSLPSMVGGEARAVLADLAPRAAHTLPMRGAERTVGVISLFLEGDEPDLAEEDLTTLTEIADRAGLLLESTRLHERQREIAETLQRSLLSPPVQPPDARVVARYVAAAEAAQVGGDWYDAFRQESGGCLLVIGDVMGHDTSAAAGMSQVRTLLRGIAYATGLGPAALLERLDAAMAALGIPSIATAVVACLEPADGGRLTLRWSNAGHLPPVLLETDGTVRELHCDTPELVLGVAPGRTRCEGSAPVAPGSVLLLHTDGLVERRGEHLGRGLARLHGLLTDAAAAAGGVAHVDLDRLVDGLVSGMLPDGGGEDDVALLAVAVGHRPRPHERGGRQTVATDPESTR